MYLKTDAFLKERNKGTNDLSNIYIRDPNTCGNTSIGSP